MTTAARCCRPSGPIPAWPPCSTVSLRLAGSANCGGGTGEATPAPPGSAFTGRREAATPTRRASPRAFRQAATTDSGGVDRVNVALLFDCGPLGLAPLAGHAHCDALSVTLWQEAADFSPTAGISLIGRTTAGGLVSGDRRPLDRPCGRSRAVGVRWPVPVARRADARCVDWQPGEAVAGEIGLAAGVRHRRSVRLVKEGKAFEITDELEAPGTHLAETL